MPLRAATARIWRPTWAETRQTGPILEVPCPENVALVQAGHDFYMSHLGPTGFHLASIWDPFGSHLVIQIGNYIHFARSV